MTHTPTADTRERVRTLASVGVRAEDVARTIGVSRATLFRHYKNELDLGAIEANVAVAKTLFEKAIGGDVACCIFWLKTRAGWRETARQELTGEGGKPLRGVIEITGI